MIKRILIVSAGVIVLTVVLVLGAKLFSGGEQKAAPPKPKPEPELTPWSGVATHPYHLAFNRRGQETTINQASFRGLERMRSSLTISLSVVGANPDDIEWVKPSAFQMINNATQRRLPAKISINTDQVTATASVKITMTNVPTDLLGLSKSEELNPGSIDPREALILRLSQMPGSGLVSVAITAPPAPAGHYLADPEVEKQYQSAVVLKRATARKMTITLGGVVNTDDAKQLVVNLNGHIVKRIPASSPFSTTVVAKTAGRHTVRVGYINSQGATLYPSAGQRTIATVAPSKPGGSK